MDLGSGISDRIRQLAEAQQGCVGVISRVASEFGIEFWRVSHVGPVSRSIPSGRSQIFVWRRLEPAAI